MSWLSFVPAVLVAAAWLLLPGLAIGYAMGLRGVACWGLAPTMSVGSIAVSAILLPKVGISWTPLTAAIPIVLLIAAIAVVALLLRNRFSVMRRPDPRAVAGWALVGLAVAAVVGTVIMLNAFGRPDHISQTYDAVFHYNAVASIVDLHNGSPNGVARNMVAGPFYPVGFHDIVSLVVMTTGAAAPGAVNAVVLVMGALVWPLGCLVLARQLFGPRPAAMVVTGVLSIAFGSFPWGLFDFGVLWPNALGLMLVPPGLAAVCALVGMANTDAIGRVRSIPVLAAALAGAVLAQPNTVFSLVALAMVPVTASVLRWALRKHRDGKTLIGIGAVILFAAALYGGWKFVNSLKQVKQVKAFDWPAFQSARSAALDVVTNGTNAWSPQYVLGALVVIGAVIALFTKGMRWVPFAHAITGFLFVLDASQDTPLSAKLTGFWYNDSFRIGAMLPITGVVLAALAVVKIGEWLFAASSKWASGRQLGFAGPALKSPVTVPAVLLVIVFAVTGALYQQRHSHVIYGSYNERGASASASVLDDQEPPFFAEVAKVVPKGAVIANNPWDGSTLIYALQDRKVLFPQMGVSLKDDRKVLAQNLALAASQPEVCAAAARLNVQYLVVAHDRFWLTDGRQKLYPGVQDPIGLPGFDKLIDHDGLRLYRITACGAR